jgi:hypothetical protein
MEKEKKCTWRFKDGNQCEKKSLRHSNYCEKHYKFWEEPKVTEVESGGDEEGDFRDSHVFYKVDPIVKTKNNKS